MAVETKRTQALSLPCPKCEKLNPLEARICTCGNWLFRPAAEAPVSALPILKFDAVREVPISPGFQLIKSTKVVPAEIFLSYTKNTKSRAPLGKYLIAALAVISAAVGVAYAAGFLSISNNTPIEMESVAVPAEVNEPQAVVDSMAGNASTSVTTDTAPEVPVVVPSGENASRPSDRQPRIETEAETAADAVSEPKPESSDWKAKLNENNSATSAAEATKGSNKVGAVARCGDGTYSYSRSATCAYRGGVAAWLDGSQSQAKPAPDAKPVQTPPANQKSGSVVYQLGPRGGCYYLGAGGSKIYVDKSYCL